MKNIIKSIALFILVISCAESEKNIQQYSIDTLMSNNISSGGSFSKDASKLVYSSDKSGVFNIYEVNLKNNKEAQLTNSEEESFFVNGYAPSTNEVFYSADKGGNEIPIEIFYKNYYYFIKSNTNAGKSIKFSSQIEILFGQFINITRLIVI